MVASVLGLSRLDARLNLISTDEYLAIMEFAKSHLSKFLSRSRIIPYQDAFLHYMYNLVLFNSYLHKIFLQLRSYERTYEPGKPPTRTPDESSRIDQSWLQNGQIESGEKIMARILADIAKNKTSYKHHCIAVVTIQLTVMVKETILILLQYLPEKSPYRLIDCFLLGRTSITGTYTQVSHRFGFLLFFQVIWASYHIFANPPVRLSCLEFLMHTPEQVQAIEFDGLCEETVQSEPNNGPNLSPSDISSSRQLKLSEDLKRASVFLPADTFMNHSSRGLTVAWNPSIAYTSKKPKITNLKPMRYPIFQYRKPELRTISKTEHKIGSGEIGYRKNRSLANWNKLTHSSVAYFLICIVGYIALSGPVSYCLWSVLITKQGFELNYSTCVNYIKSLDQEDRSQWSFIYWQDGISDNANARPLGLALDYVNIMPFNEVYHMARLAADAIQSCVVFNIVALSQIAESYHAIVIARDIEHYLEWLESGMDKLVSDLRFDRTARREFLQLDFKLDRIRRRQTLRAAVESESDSARRKSIIRDKPDRIHLTRQISDIQAQLMDFWMLIAHYNTFISNYVWTIIIVWICYSAVAADYLLAPSGVIYYEVIFGHLFSTIYFIVVVGHFAIIRRRIKRLYPLITSAMALDDDCIDSKARWPSIMTYYHPNPMYCFTVGGLTVSWNFCLQASTMA